MLASEFAFLVLGMAIGIPTGAALLQLIRARPRGSREVRLTVTPDSVPRRRSATLATDPFEDSSDPAAGGPAEASMRATSRRSSQAAAAERSSADRSADAVAGAQDRTNVLSTGAEAAHAADDEGETGTAPSATSSRVGIAIGEGADPVLAAIKREPVARPFAIEEVLQEPEPALSGIALLEKAVEARAAQRAAGSRATAVSEPPSATRAASGDDRVSASASGGDGQDDQAPTSDDIGTAAQGGAASAAPAAAPISYTGPCADQRRTTDEVCGLAERMAGQADVAAGALRAAQRQYDTHLATADRAAAIADPRSLRAAKEAAQHSFRQARADATSQAAVEDAARTWLQEINRINTASRDAGQQVARERQAASAMALTLERLTLEADAARVQAEAAREGCINAREALATCEEAVLRGEAQAVAAASAATAAAAQADAAPAPPQLRLGGAQAADPVVAGVLDAADRPGGDDTDAEEAGALAAASARGDGQPAILQLLGGDRDALERLSNAVAGTDAADQRHWQLQLAEFVDAIVSRAIEACAFEFPPDHPFWGPFTVEQNRDIALALSSLGFRFDGLGGFADERVPTQRDLSLAVGYAGLDPMRIRRWPTDAELLYLFREVRVAADEYLSGAAGGLTLGELVTLLGRRADGLTDLWNAWGRVRPRLLEPI